ncbi:hypothetical protein PV646_20565 [Streptomyces sp. ID05-26A]|nr:hypothetical protein [Streptomyces sp. ID05-26A]
MSPEIEAMVIAAAVKVLPQVAGPHSGRYGEIATLLPGRRIAGIRLRPGEIVIGVVARYPVTTAELDAAVRAAVHAAIGRVEVPVHLWIGDIAFSPVLSPGITTGRRSALKLSLPSAAAGAPSRAPATTSGTTP